MHDATTICLTTRHAPGMVCADGIVSVPNEAKYTIVSFIFVFDHTVIKQNKPVCKSWEWYMVLVCSYYCFRECGEARLPPSMVMGEGGRRYASFSVAPSINDRGRFTLRSRPTKESHPYPRDPRITGSRLVCTAF